MSVSVGPDRRVRLASRRNAGRVGLLVAAVVGWEGISATVGPSVLPGPVESAALAADGLVGEGWMVENLLNTLAALAGAFLLASVLGIAIGATLGLNDAVRSVFEPFLLNTYAVPKIILFPVFLFVFQIGIDQKIAFGAFHGVFPLAIILSGAVRETPETHLEVARSLRLSRWQVARHIVFPSVVGPLLVGLRFAFNLGFLGVILSELFAARSGLGLILQRALGSVNTPRILAVTLVIVVVALIVNFVFYAAQRVLELRLNVTVNEGGL